MQCDPSPPRLAVLLLARCLPEGAVRDSILGDLREMYEERAKFGSKCCGLNHRPGRHTCEPQAVWCASVWYWQQTIVVGGRYAVLRVIHGRFYRQLCKPSTSRPQLQSLKPLRSMGDRMQTVFSDIRLAARTFLKQPGFAIVPIMMLAIGVGANVAAFSVINAALLEPLPYAEPDRLMLGRVTYGGEMGGTTVSAHDYYDYRDRSDAFETLSAITPFPITHTITGGDEPERGEGLYVSVDFFATLGVLPQLGRAFADDEGVLGAPPVVMVSHGFWKRRLGGAADVLSHTLRIDGLDHTIVGVMPVGFEFLYDVDLWRPLRLGGPLATARRFNNWVVIGRLRNDATHDKAQSQMDAISAQLGEEFPESNRDKGIMFVPLHHMMTEDFRSSLFLLMGTVAFVLLIACANVAGLLMARGSTRRTELAVRAALGASRWRLTRQLLTESIGTALAAGAFGTLIGVWLHRLALQFLPVDVPGFDASGLSATVFVFALFLSVTTGIAFGAFPALHGSRANAVDVVRAGARSTHAAGSRFRSALVIAEVALSVVLLIGSGLFIRSLARLQKQEIGFDAHNLLTAEIGLPSSEYDAEARIQFLSALINDVRATPGVVDVAMINRLPMRDPWSNYRGYAADRPPVDDEDWQSGNQRFVFPGYFEAMGIQLLAGRGIAEIDGPDSPSVLVLNQTLANLLFANEDPIGRQVVFDIGQEVTFEVVGVVADVLMDGLAMGPRGAFYGSYYQRPYSTMGIAVRTDTEPTAFTRQLREALWRLDRDIPLAAPRLMDEVIATSGSQRKAVTVALGVLASVALFLAVIGLYGMLAYYVNRRIREIGIRLALGANTGNVVKLILNRGISLVGVGIAVGLLGAFGLTRLIRQMLFGVEPTDVTTFVGVGLLFALVSMLACLIPAWRAVKVDPLVAMDAQ